MKYLPLLAFGLLATPAFADDVNVKPAPIPNEITSTAQVAVVCPEARSALFDTYQYKPCHSVTITTQNRRTPLILTDNVNVAVKPLSNATATFTAIPLSCEIQPDASLDHCRLADGAKASEKDLFAAIGQVNGKGHVAGAFVAGHRTQVTVTLHANDGTSLVPIG